jgi:hypothetical protein
VYKPDITTLALGAGAASIPVLTGGTLICVGKGQIGLALLMGGTVPLLTNLMLLIYAYIMRHKDIRGVLKVVLRDRGLIFDTIEKDLQNAKSIQILGNILYRDLFGIDEFNKILEGRANDDLKVNICLYKPDNQFLKIRALDEIDRKEKSKEEIEKTSKENLDRMNAEIGWTLDKIKSLKKKLKEKIDIKFINSTYILDSIILVDDKKVVVVDYLHQRGRGSPVFILKDNPVCKAYRDEFNRMWELGIGGE